jgi:hypothetical protein
MATIKGANTIKGTYGPLRFAGVPVDGTSGTYKGAEKGATLIDTTNGVEYINTGTTTSPTWTVKGSQAAA